MSSIFSHTKLISLVEQGQRNRSRRAGDFEAWGQHLSEGMEFYLCANHHVSQADIALGRAESSSADSQHKRLPDGGKGAFHARCHLLGWICAVAALEPSDHDVVVATTAAGVLVVIVLGQHDPEFRNVQGLVHDQSSRVIFEFQGTDDANSKTLSLANRQVDHSNKTYGYSVEVVHEREVKGNCLEKNSEANAGKCQWIAQRSVQQIKMTVSKGGRKPLDGVNGSVKRIMDNLTRTMNEWDGT